MQKNTVKYMVEINEVKVKINNHSNIEMTVEEKVNVEPPKVEAKPVAEAPKVETKPEPVAEVPKVETKPVVEAPKPEPVAEAPKVEAKPVVEAPKAVSAIDNKEEVITLIETQLKETLDGLTSAFKQFDEKKRSVAECRAQLMDFEKKGMNVSAALEPLTAQLNDVSNKETALLHLFKEKTSELYGIFKSNV